MDMMNGLRRFARLTLVLVSSAVVSWTALAQDPPQGDPDVSADPPVGNRDEVEPEEPTPATAAPPSTTPWTFFEPNAAGLTGDWGGVRTRLDEEGIRFSLFLNHQFGAIVAGGRDTSHAYRGSASIDGFVTLDLGRLGVLDDGEVLLHYQSNWGAGANPWRGSLAEVNDDADGDLGLHVAQLWYRRHFWERKASVTIGFLDYQTIVDRNALANSEDKQFLNQSLDNNPLLPLSIGLGVAVIVEPVEEYTLILGVADAESVLYKPGFSTAFHDEDLFVGYMEHGLHLALPGSKGELKGNYRAGLVYDPRERSKFIRSGRRGEVSRNDRIVYVSADQMLWLERSGSDQGLGAFFRYGRRDPDTSRFATFWSGGLSYAGLIPERDADVLGIAFALQRPSRVFRDRVDTQDRQGSETVYELYYAIQVTKWLTITPDVQYIDNPGGDRSQSHTIAGHIRVRWSF
jgi:porin